MSAPLSPRSPLLPGDHTATVNGTALRYRVRGHGPVLIVQPPGWGIGSAPYQGSFGPLEETSTVVYLDPRGSIGATPEPASKLHVASFVDDLEALREHLGLDSFALAGHSHGGLIAAHYALRYPERVRALLLLCPQLVGVHGHPSERDAQADPEEDADLAAGYAFLESVGGFHAMAHATSDVEATDFLKGIAPLYFREGRHGALLRALLDERPLPVRTMQAVSAADRAFPLEEARLRACPVPTLAVSGRYDVFCPPSTAARLARTMPHARQRVFERSGHFPWIEDADGFFATVRGFLMDPTMIPAR